MAGPRSVVVLYVGLVLTFLAANWFGSQRPDATRSPAIVFTRATGAGPDRLRKLDLGHIRKSINRLPAVTFMRQAGNSLRLFFGQQLSWCIWGGGDPLMLFHRAELGIAKGLTDSSVRATMEIAADRIALYSYQLESEGWKVVVVPVPTKLSIYSDLCHWPTHSDSLSWSPIPVDRADEVYQAFIARLKERGILAVNLALVYQRARTQAPHKLLYPPAETHWSGEGIRVAALASAEKISATAGIKQRNIVPTYFEVSVIGDLAAGFDPLPGWLGRLAPIYRYRDYLVNGAQGIGYIYPANPSAFLVVAGTSYSGHYTGHTGQPVGFPWVTAGYLENTEVHNRSQAGRGSFESFRQFWAERAMLVESFNHRAGPADAPRVLLWEFPLRDIQTIVTAAPLP